MRPASLIPLFAALMVAGCGALGGTTPTPSATCSHTPPLSYDNFGDGFMAQNCTACHHSLLPAESRNNAPLGVDLDTYRDVITWRERIRARTLDTETMPPGGGVGAQQLLDLDEWLSCQVAEDAAYLEQEGDAATRPRWGDGHE